MKTKIIFDTDIGCDCDDAAALALALELMNAGECELLAVTSCTMSDAAAGCIEAILGYYGHPEIPVGTFREEDALKKNEWHDVYATDTALQYDTRYKKGERYENTVKLLRRTLSESEEKVKIVATGQMTSLARLLMSGPDSYSQLSGVELVRQKVEAAACMAGRFFETWPEPVVLGDGYVVDEEWNVTCDIEAAQTVCRQWPSELVFCSYEIGWKMITCGGLQTKGSKNNPVRTCYETWSSKEGGGAVGRESWDSATMLYAIRPWEGYWDLHAYGRIDVDHRGKTTWSPKADGRHSYLLEKLPSKQVEDVINGILERDLERTSICIGR